jgi:hypothetical protein
LWSPRSDKDERGILSHKGFEQIWRKEGEIMKRGSKAFEEKAGRRV